MGICREGSKDITVKNKPKKATTRIEHVVGVKVPVTKLYSGSVHANEADGRRRWKNNSKERMLITN